MLTCHIDTNRTLKITHFTIFVKHFKGFLMEFPLYFLFATNINTWRWHKNKFNNFFCLYSFALIGNWNIISWILFNQLSTIFFYCICWIVVLIMVHLFLFLILAFTLFLFNFLFIGIFIEIHWKDSCVRMKPA